MSEAAKADRGFKSQRMFAEMVFCEAKKMDEEVWNTYFLEASQLLHRFRRIQIQKNKQQPAHIQHQVQSSALRFQQPPLAQPLCNSQWHSQLFYSDPLMNQTGASSQSYNVI